MNRPVTTIRIFESELEQIASVATASPDLETGGELLGLWSHGDSPTILAASVTVVIAGTPGPASRRGTTWFEQDANAHMELERLGWEKFGIQVVGLWHSHHRLGLHDLSSGDIRRTQGYSTRHNRPRYTEILAYLEQPDGHEDYITMLKPHVYDDASSGMSLPTRIVPLPGQSPIREALHKIRDDLHPGVKCIVEGPKRRRRDKIQYHFDHAPAMHECPPEPDTGMPENRPPNVADTAGGAEQSDEAGPLAIADRSPASPSVATTDDGSSRPNEPVSARMRATGLMENLLSTFIPPTIAAACQAKPNGRDGITLFVPEGRRGRLRLDTYVEHGHVLVAMTLRERRGGWRSYPPIDGRSPDVGSMIATGLHDAGFRVR